MYFNKNIAISNGALAYLYKDGVLYDTITTPSALQANDNILYLEFNISTMDVGDIETGRYSIVPPNVSSANNIENWSSYALNDWYFDVTNGDYLGSDYDENDYLINI